MVAGASTSRGGASQRTLLVGAAFVLVVLAALVTAAVLLRPGRQVDQPPTAAQARGSETLQDRPAADRRFPLPRETLEGFAGGKDVALADFRGKPLVVNFWATWCAPCVEEMPIFRDVANSSRGKVTFLGVDVQDAPSNAEPFVKKLGIDYPLALDPDGELWRATGSFGMPTTLFVDADGMVVYRHTGALDAEQLRELLRSELGVRL